MISWLTMCVTGETQCTLDHIDSKEPDCGVTVRNTG